MYVNIFAFALVLVVAGTVALAWITFDLKLECGKAVSSTDTLRIAHGRLSQRVVDLAAQSPTQLAVEVAELRDAVARLANTQRRFAGRFDQWVHEIVDDAPTTEKDSDRDELRRKHANAILPVGLKR